MLMELFASFRQKCGLSTQGCADEEGAELTRRLHELLDLEKPIETPSAETSVKPTKG